MPPPDQEARLEILRAHTSGIPGGERLDLRSTAKETDGLTGADLKALCEQAAELALERSLSGGKIDSRRTGRW